ncbi:LppU/SCO3897 family protein [Streptomyces cavernae]|uniref:LppU/SCO3897 family protein n=1 Tax=Streptomyces cavernae TaxID=2259034 RepID=UPI000FEBCFDB|nr:hypothetical protein [Streptomyces cavernae]
MTVPPQGQNPFAQGQQPYPQQPYPPQGGNPYAQQQPQPGNPYAQQPQGYPPHPGQPGFPTAPLQPQRPKRGFKFFLRIGIVICALIAAGVGWVASRDDANTAKVGDCMSISNPDSVTDPGLEVVDCKNSKAKYKVAEKKNDTSGCDRTKYAEYTETGGGDDFTLCLQEYSAK